MTFHFTYHTHTGTPVTATARPLPVARWSRCTVSGRPVRQWQPVVAHHAMLPVSGHDAPPGAADLLAALLRRHRELRAA